jgi:hypothetical protein
MAALGAVGIEQYYRAGGCRWQPRNLHPYFNSDRDIPVAAAIGSSEESLKIY